MKDEKNNYVTKELKQKIITSLKGIPKYVELDLKKYFTNFSNKYNIKYQDLEKIYLSSIKIDNLLIDKPLFDYEYFFQEFKKLIDIQIEIVSEEELKQVGLPVLKKIIEIKKSNNKISLILSFEKNLKNSIALLFIIKNLLDEQNITSLFLAQDSSLYCLRYDGKLELFLESKEVLNFITLFETIDTYLFIIYFIMLRYLFVNKNTYNNKDDYLNEIYQYLGKIFPYYSQLQINTFHVKRYIRENIFNYINKDPNTKFNYEKTKEFEYLFLPMDPDVYNHYQLEKVKDELEKTKNETLREIKQEQKNLETKIKKDDIEIKKFKKQMQKSKNDIFSIMALFLTAFSVGTGFIGFSSQSAILDFNTIFTIGFFITTFIAIIWAIVKEIISHDNSKTKYLDILKFLGTIFGIYFLSAGIVNIIICLVRHLF